MSFLKNLFFNRDKSGDSLASAGGITGFLQGRHHLLMQLQTDVARAVTSASTSDVEPLRARIAAVEAQIDNPEDAYAEAQAASAEIATLFTQAAFDIPSAQLDLALNALADLDFAPADALFAMIETRDHRNAPQAAKAAFGRGAIAEAQLLWPEAATHYARSAAFDPTAETLSKAGYFLWQTGAITEAVEMAAQALDQARARTPPNPDALSAALAKLGAYQHATGAYEQAEPLYREALDLCAARSGDTDISYAMLLNNLASLLQAQGRPADAKPLLQQALAIFETTLGPNHPNAQAIRDNLERVGA